MSALEETFAFQVKLARLPKPEREVFAIPGRQFRFDFGWRPQRLLVEVQGGTFGRGRTGHSSGMGINRDCEKNNLAVLAGWRVLKVDVKHVTSGQALQWVQEALKETA